MRRITRRLRHPQDAAEKLIEKVGGRFEHPNRLAPRGDIDELGSDDGFGPIWSSNREISDHDADETLVRAIYRIVRSSQPDTVVETGVARGVTSYVILSALELNGKGRLCSVDLPPERSDLRRAHTAAVPAHLRERWTLRLGSSRRVLPALLEELGAVDVFVHDSAHTERNMRWEYELAWPHLSRGGFLVSDDVHRNAAFGDFIAARGCPHTIGEMRKGGLFGVAFR